MIKKIISGDQFILVFDLDLHDENGIWMRVNKDRQ